MKTRRFFGQSVVIAVIGLMMIYSSTVNAADPSTESQSITAPAGSITHTRSTVNFITLRNQTKSGKASEVFGDERDIARAGSCEVVRTTINSLKSIAELASFYIPDGTVKVESVREKSFDELWRGIEKTASGKRPILYTHGFNISFDRACRRASLFQDTLGVSERFLLFSWPSDGSITNYMHDEADLYWSVLPFVETLNEMVDRFGAGNVDAVAHSLGTRGLVLSLARMAHSDYPQTPPFNNVVLFAADMDAGIFAQYLPKIRPLARKITLYVSDNDAPLALSRQLHGYPRLGEFGPHLDGLKGVEIIDVSEVPIRAASGHLYHLYNDGVTNDIASLLNDGKPASERNNLERVNAGRWRMVSPEIEN